MQNAEIIRLRGTDEMAELPKRKQIRLKEYDYSQNGYYFVTICTKDRQNIFGKIEIEKVILTGLGNIVESEIQNINKRYNNVFIDNYVIMPNHIHMIVVIQYDKQNAFNTESDKHFDIPNVIGRFKAGISRKCGFTVWQRGYYEHIIRDEQDYQVIYEYISNNPIKWSEDKYYG